jgi:peptide/nickel transport system permease protein
MFKYILKRLLFFVPTLIVISLLCFLLSKKAPGDPVELIIRGGSQGGAGGQRSDMIAGDRAYQEKAEMLGLNLPVFYFGVTSKAYPDTLFKIVQRDRRENLSALIARYGNWKEIEGYYVEIGRSLNGIFEVPKDSSNTELIRNIQLAINDLYDRSEDYGVQENFNTIRQNIGLDSSLQGFAPQFGKLQMAYDAIKTNATPSKLLIPDFQWYGMNNQYHNWFSKFVRGDFGVSYLDSRPIKSKIGDALKWTLIINIVSIILAYLFSIPLGIMMAVKKGSRTERATTFVLFLMYSLPVFWVATLLIVFFSTSEYGAWLDWFPTGGLHSDNLSESAPFMTRFLDYGYHFTLPILCSTYGTLAYISRQMRGGMLSVLRQDYIRTARAKGLGEREVIWHHAFRNSLFPIITLFASVFPRAIAGSVIIEVIFSIPGMGMLSYGAILARDWPMVFTILMFAAILTMVGNLIADILYSVADPRVSFGARR